ncbi:MAG: tRNA (adenosine(37)-N6)-threonylcarbamoyltransferase complex ATPase subunit type 1 TsaE [Burkholderiales bacterium]
MKSENVLEDWFLPDEESTLELGTRLAHALAPGMLLALRGDLGSGKTTLTRGVLRGLGYTGKVKSPTYTLVEHYKPSTLDLYHFDFYRFANAEEWSDAGFRDYFDGHNVCVVEWPERVAGQLPPADLEIMLSIEGAGRRARAQASTPLGIACVQSLRHTFRGPQ